MISFVICHLALQIISETIPNSFQLWQAIIYFLHQSQRLIFCSGTPSRAIGRWSLCAAQSYTPNHCYHCCPFKLNLSYSSPTSTISFHYLMRHRDWGWGAHDGLVQLKATKGLLNEIHKKLFYCKTHLYSKDSSVSSPASASVLWVLLVSIIRIRYHLSSAFSSYLKTNIQWAHKHWFLPVRELLGEAKVGQTDVSFAVQQDVLRLQVSIHNFFGVEVLNGTNDLRGIEKARGVAEAPTAP